MKIIVFFALILSIFVVSACQTASTETKKNLQPSVTQNEIKQISVEQAKNAVDAKDVQFVDVRTVEEYAGGHAPKAVNLPLDSLENELSTLDKTKPVYVICQTGRCSKKGAEILQKAGFTNIYNIEGGTSAWVDADLPIEKN